MIITDKLINDYLSGNDLEGVSLEQLEDCKAFMEKAISVSGDEKLYNLCSKNVKSSSGFMRFLIKKFHNKFEFLVKASDFYFNNSTDIFDSMEIAVIMKVLAKKNNDDREIDYQMKSNLFYTLIRYYIEQAKLKNKDLDEDCGFIYIFDIYKNNELMLKYFAKKLLKELFVDDYYILENILHEQYDSVDEIESKGYNNCLIDVIRIYDDMLSSYVCVHRELLSILYPKLDRTVKGWDKYVNKNEVLKYDLLFERVNDYMSDKEDYSLLNRGDLLYIVGNKLGILDNMIKYEILREGDITIYKEIEEYISSVLKSSLVDRINYNKVKEIISDILFPNEMEKEIKIDAESDSKILNFEKYKKRIKSKN